jgi:hypothetical protein
MGKLGKHLGAHPRAVGFGERSGDLALRGVLLGERIDEGVGVEEENRRGTPRSAARLYRLPSASERSPQGVYRPVPADYAALIPNELKTVLNFPDFVADNLSKMKAGYLATGSTPSLARFGWIRT